MNIPVPPSPSNIIQLDKVECSERSIEGLVPYNPLHSFSLVGGFFTASSLSERFNYVTMPENHADGSKLYVLDLFLGTSILILPKNPDEVIKIWRYSYLSPNRGFFIFETANKSGRASIIEIDFKNRSYELIGDSYKIDFYEIDYYGAFLMENLVVVANVFCRKTLKHVVHFFKVEKSLNTIKSCRRRKSFSSCCLFNVIDGKLIFSCMHADHYALEDFIILNEDDTFAKIENTSALFPDFGNGDAFPTFESFWHGNKAFVFINYIFYGDYPGHSVRSEPCSMMFNLETKIWSEICLSLPSNRIFYQFHLDENCFLSVVTYDKIGKKTGYFWKLRPASIRIPFKIPDKLMNLCWFRARDCGLSDICTDLKNLI